MRDIRIFCLCVSLVVSSFSAVFSVFGGYPTPELIALAFLGFALGRSTGLTILLSGYLIGTFVFANGYYIWSTLIFCVTVLSILNWNDLRYLCSTPLFRRCMAWCFFLNIVLIVLQTVPPIRVLTQSIFHEYITFGTGLRVAGLKQEPSHLVIFVGIAFLLMQYQSKLIINAVYVVSILTMVYLSNSALLGVACICMGLFVFLRRWLTYLSVVILPASLFVLIYAESIAIFLQDSQQSWRSIPDIALMTSELFYWPDFSRDKNTINIAVSNLLGAPTYITWTYSAFANAVFCLGIGGVITLGVIWIYRMGSRNGALSIFRFFIQAWPVLILILFAVPKYEVVAILLFIMVVYEALDTR